MSKEQKDKINEYRKAWYHRQDEEKKGKMRACARNRYYAIKVC